MSWIDRPGGPAIGLAEVAGEALMKQAETIADQRGAIVKLGEAYDELLNKVMKFAPPCWADADPIEGVAVAYVRSLEGHGDNPMAGHASSCNCPGNYPDGK